MCFHLRVVWLCGFISTSGSSGHVGPVGHEESCCCVSTVGPSSRVGPSGRVG